MNTELFVANIAKELAQKPLLESQMRGFEAFVIYYLLKEYPLDSQFCYVLATVWHETGFKMQPVEEIGKGKGLKYGRKVKNAKGERYDYPNHIYYGRGHVQLTWYDNYLKAGKELGLGTDLLENPNLALDLTVSVAICVEGMRKGWFSGKKLDNYFSNKLCLPVKARAIVNGKDKADKIARYYNTIYKCLERAKE